MHSEKRIELTAQIAGQIAARQPIGPGSASELSVWVSIAAAIVRESVAREEERLATEAKRERIHKDPNPKAEVGVVEKASEPEVAGAEKTSDEPSDEEILERATS